MMIQIKVNLDLLLVQRKMSLTELSQKVGVTMANLSILKRGKAKAIRFSTLLAICQALDCSPGDLLDLEKNQS
ncbi:MAG: putative transcriptional regulator [Polaribacter sp.]|jgi:putative transcriptional regulator